MVRQGPGTMGLSSSLVPLSRELGPGPSLRTLLQTTIRTPKTSDFQAELFPRVIPPDLGSRPGLWVIKSFWTGTYDYMTRIEFTTACQDAPGVLSLDFGQPRATCPRPEGLGHNLRSKTRWFTGFCNSHQVSHFATFFIDARAEISVAESHFRLYIVALLPNKHRLRVGESRLFSCVFLDTFCDGVWCYPEATYDPTKIEVLGMDERITTESAGTVRNRPTESDVSSFSGRSVSRVRQ
ncbi:hypothetical protein YC2023_066309 [Brassica napus]